MKFKYTRCCSRMIPFGPSSHHSSGVKYALTSAAGPERPNHWIRCRLSDWSSHLAISISLGSPVRRALLYARFVELGDRLGRQHHAHLSLLELGAQGARETEDSRVLAVMLAKSLEVPA